MFSGRQPGQTVTTRTDMVTEVKIAVTQTRTAILAGLVLAVLAQWQVVIPLGNFIAQRQPQLSARVVAVELWTIKALLSLAVVIPIVALFVSMTVQIYDVNSPPPKRSMNPAITTEIARITTDETMPMTTKRFSDASVRSSRL